MSSSKRDIEQKKKQVIEKLKNGEFIAKVEPPSSSHGSFWEHLLRIKCSNNEYQPFVQCTLCHEILSYSMSHGTSTISYHVKNCLDKSNKLKNNKTISSYLSKSTDVKVTVDDKRSITIACAKLCSFDMRPFSIVKGRGFTFFCQSLINLGYQYGTTKLGPPSASSLLPDPTNISRTVSQIAEEERERLKNILKVDLQHVKMVGVSTDYWKNSGTSESYLTINIHYSKNEQNVTYMLRTSLFAQSKTGDNTRQRIFSVLLSYDIDPNQHHVVYITDNGSNLVCGLQGEVHLRCICHCLNLSLHNGVSLCPNLELLIKSCQELCVHFKRCEMNQLLSTTLKINVDTRWNSIHDMMQSISLNFHKCEDLLLDRNEIYYLDDINRKLLSDLTLSRSFRNEIYADTRKIIKTIGIQQQQSSSTTATTNSNKPPKKKKTDLVMESDVMQEFAGHVDSDCDDNSDEIDRYINSKLSFSNDDTLLGWWSKHSLIFPQLTLLARSLFGIPASSATSERVFSSTGRILEKRRQLLNPDIVDDILMIRNFRDA
ncbi:unnamed protein product [Rotaria sp. Silwood2]|nr:unnamed protein product [Rotaria sp. Silwood2]